MTRTFSRFEPTAATPQGNVGLRDPMKTVCAVSRSPQQLIVQPQHDTSTNFPGTPAPSGRPRGRNERTKSISTVSLKLQVTD